MNYLNYLPDISLRKLALCLSAIDYKDLNRGQLRLKLNPELVDKLLIDTIASNKYLEEINVRFADRYAELHFTFNLKGIPFTTTYCLSVEQFVFSPARHQAALKVERKGTHNRVIEGIYDLTAKPFLIELLKSYGFTVNEPYLYIDIEQQPAFHQFQASFLGSLLIAGTTIEIEEFSSSGITFKIDISELKEIGATVKTLLTQVLAEKTSGQESA